MNLQDLARHRTIDLTTIGARTGREHRIEIWWFFFEGRFIVTGTPGRRDWLANVRADSRVTVHAGPTDAPGVAREVADPEFRRRFFNDGQASWYSTQAELDRLVLEAPMIEILLNEARDS